MIVVDASVAAKWLLPEPGQEQAAALLRDSAGLLAPALIRLEVAGAITRRFRLGAMPATEAQERYQSWCGLLRDGVVSLVPDEALVDRAVELSVQIQHALLDCLYLAAALHQGVPLITADVTFQKRAAVVSPAVQLLAVSQTN